MKIVGIVLASTFTVMREKGIVMASNIPTKPIDETTIDLKIEAVFTPYAMRYS